MNPRPHLAYSLHLPQQCTLEILPAAINAYALVQCDSVSNGHVKREESRKKEKRKKGKQWKRGEKKGEKNEEGNVSYAECNQNGRLPLR